MFFKATTKPNKPQELETQLWRVEDLRKEKEAVAGEHIRYCLWLKAEEKHSSRQTIHRIEAICYFLRHENTEHFF